MKASLIALDYKHHSSKVQPTDKITIKLAPAGG